MLPFFSANSLSLLNWNVLLPSLVDNKDIFCGSACLDAWFIANVATCIIHSLKLPSISFVLTLLPFSPKPNGAKKEVVFKPFLSWIFKPFLLPVSANFAAPFLINQALPNPVFAIPVASPPALVPPGIILIISGDFASITSWITLRIPLVKSCFIRIRFANSAGSILNGLPS